MACARRGRDPLGRQLAGQRVARSDEVGGRAAGSVGARHREGASRLVGGFDQGPRRIVAVPRGPAREEPGRHRQRGVERPALCREAAEHGVDEAGRRRGPRQPHRVDRGVDRQRRGVAEHEDLRAREPQRGPHARIERAEPGVHERTEAHVDRPQPAQRRVDQRVQPGPIRREGDPLLPRREQPVGPGAGLDFGEHGDRLRSHLRRSRGGRAARGRCRHGLAHCPSLPPSSM